jgi:hypothetical protein
VSRADELKARFWEFHNANPSVLEALIDMADEARRRGVKTSIAQLFEVLRWERTVMVDRGDSEFKLNNSYRALYVREIARRRPDLADMFATRRSLADRPAVPATVEDDGGQIRWEGVA